MAAVRDTNCYFTALLFLIFTECFKRIVIFRKLVVLKSRHHVIRLYISVSVTDISIKLPTFISARVTGIRKFRILARRRKTKFANMASHCEKVVLCRGLSEKNDSQWAYVKVLETAGYSCDCLPTLCFEFVNRSELRTCLLSSSSYYGLILTSRRAVEAIEFIANEDTDILQSWKSLPVFCVGPATEYFAKSHLGSENCFGKETGNAKELAELLVTVVAQESKPLLYPCSEIGRETIEKTLNENNIKVHRIVVYKTLPSKNLEHDLMKFMDNVPRIFVFFSPSIVQYIVDLLNKKSYNMNNIKAVAIGPVTRQALLEAGLKPFATVNKPEPTSLLDAINDAEKGEVDDKTE